MNLNAERDSFVESLFISKLTFRTNEIFELGHNDLDLSTSVANEYSRKIAYRGNDNRDVNDRNPADEHDDFVIMTGTEIDVNIDTGYGDGSYGFVHRINFSGRNEW